MPTLTHLHVHSHFTLLGATPAIDDLVAAAQADQMSHLALTDHNVLYGVVAFNRACIAAQIVPILGMTITVQLPQTSEQSPDQLLLLATGKAGYQSLCRLSSLIQSSPDRQKLAQQGISWDDLKSNRSGLIAIAGGRQSWLERWLRNRDNNRDKKAASNYLGRFSGLFDDHGYLALELHTPADEPIMREMSALGQRFGLPSVAVQPIYTLAPHERSRLRLLAAIDRNCKLDEVPNAALPDQGNSAIDLHWLRPAEMQQRFAAFAPALTEIESLVARCQPSLPDGKPIFPVLNLPTGASAEATLTNLAEKGMANLYPNATSPNPADTDSALRPSISQRLHDELTLINRTGYAPLFLVVADIVQFARSQNIPVSTRGSVANSLVAYCTSITTVDPIANDLLFERFLNPERGNPPDIDLDFCSVRRDEVLDYVRRTYGADRVALVATVSTMRPRSAVGETAKAYGIAESESAQLVKQLPDEWHPDPRRRFHSTPDALLAKLPNEDQRRVVKAAYDLIGTPHHLSIHPGGLVITPAPMTDFAPVQWTPKGFLIIQFDHEHAEAIGLTKLDLLGIRALTVLAAAAELVRRHYDPTFSLESIATDDVKTAEMLTTGDTVGVFQCESAGARRTLRQLKAKTIADLAVANAFFKPGPATGGMASSFIRRYRGDEAASYLHPALEPVLGFTKGVLIFQEQVLRVAHQIAGLSWGEADLLRKGMSKFQADAMTQIRTRFIEGCVAVSNFSSEQATTLWEQVQAFAGYGFNQGHATAYADVSYRSAWLKAHFPAAFLAARLANYGGFHHPAIYIAEAQRLGISVRPPHVNHSEHDFTLGFAGMGSAEGAGDLWVRDAESLTDATCHLPPATLWMGLGQVHSLRQGTIESILSERNKQPFVDLDDLQKRVALQQRELVNLIQCGALDGLAESRAALLERLNRLGADNRRQLTFDFAAAPVAHESAEQKLRWEQEILGQPISVDPLQTATQWQRKGVTLDQAAAPVATQRGQTLSLICYRLPGWTGGKGFYISDGTTYAVAIPTQEISTEKISVPKPWTLIAVKGRWLVDEWGGGWLQIENLLPIPVGATSP